MSQSERVSESASLHTGLRGALCDRDTRLLGAPMPGGGAAGTLRMRGKLKSIVTGCLLSATGRTNPSSSVQMCYLQHMGCVMMV